MSNQTPKIIGFSSIFIVMAIIVALVINENNKHLEESLAANTQASFFPAESNKDQVSSELGFRDSLIAFAKKQLLVPYKYASCDPNIGFDCSGFVFYVFREFRIKTPRSSSLFLSYGKKKALDSAELGDVMVFTGTDRSSRVGGHVGIVVSSGDSISFIHSSSGKAKGVTISSLEEGYYKKRYLGLRDYISDASDEF